VVPGCIFLVSEQYWCKTVHFGVGQTKFGAKQNKFETRRNNFVPDGAILVHNIIADVSWTRPIIFLCSFPLSLFFLPSFLLQQAIHLRKNKKQSLPIPPPPPLVCLAPARGTLVRGNVILVSDRATLKLVGTTLLPDIITLVTEKVCCST
jgi:hypothetical protein